MVRNLERAEDIDPAALAAGIDWSFETFPEYLDAVDRLAKGINFAANVGHSALRTWAMGERAFEEEADRRRPRRHGGPAGRRPCGPGPSASRPRGPSTTRPRTAGRWPPAWPPGTRWPRWSASWASSGTGIFEGADAGMSAPDPDVRAPGPRPDDGPWRPTPGCR